MCGKSSVELKARYGAFPVQLLGDRALKILPKVIEEEEYPEDGEQANIDMERLVCRRLVDEGHPHIVKVYAVHDMGAHDIIEMERLTPFSSTPKNLWNDHKFLVNTAHAGRSLERRVDSMLDRMWNYMPWLDCDNDTIDRVMDAHLEVWCAIDQANEHLKALGLEHHDQHDENWMLDSFGTLKLIDFDRVRTL